MKILNNIVSYVTETNNILQTSFIELFGQEKIIAALNRFCTRILRISQQEKTENWELWNKTENENMLWYNRNCNFSNLFFNNIKEKKEPPCCVYMQSTFVLYQFYFITLKNGRRLRKYIRFSSVPISILVALSVSWLLLSRIFQLIYTSHRRLHINCGVSELLGVGV